MARKTKADLQTEIDGLKKELEVRDSWLAQKNPQAKVQFTTKVMDMAIREMSDDCELIQRAMLALVADCFAPILEMDGAENYVELTLVKDEGEEAVEHMRFIVCKPGEEHSPHKLREKAEAEVARFREVLEWFADSGHYTHSYRKGAGFVDAVGQSIAHGALKGFTMEQIEEGEHYDAD